jgi:mRNA interferase MazF
MKRGEVWWVNFEPSIGGEIKKTRPAVIISNDSSNLHMNRVQVIPTTSKTSKLFPCEAFVIIKGQRSKAMADQIMTVSKGCLSEKIDMLSHETMLDINRILKVQLGLL